MGHDHAKCLQGTDSNPRELHLEPKGKVVRSLGWSTWQDSMLALHSSSTKRTLVLFVLHIGLLRKISFEERVPQLQNI